MEWYFVVWYLAATGARVSELIQIKLTCRNRVFDLYTKWKVAKAIHTQDVEK